MNTKPIINAMSSHVTLRVAVTVWLGWAATMSTYALWHLFDANWFMSVTMAVGSFVAGSTSEGGGAVAFPVMTLGFGIAPMVARDFALMIQSVGMTAATITILAMGIQVDLRAIKMACLGAIPGFIVGAEVLSPLLTPAVTKLFFVSFWLAFGLTLQFRHRKNAPSLQDGIPPLDHTSALTLLALGVVGGAATGITGCGLDIVVFSYLVMGRGLNEKIATPTSVVLMACISVIGFAFRALVSDTPIPAEAWDYWSVSIPVVVVGAPLGALFIAQRSREFVISLLVVAIVAQFIGALVILPMTPNLAIVTIVTFAGALGLFMSLARREPKLQLPHIHFPSEPSHV